MRETEGILLNSPEPMPSDPHQDSRVRPQRKTQVSSEKRDKLKRFLEKDRKVILIAALMNQAYKLIDLNFVIGFALLLYLG